MVCGIFFERSVDLYFIRFADSFFRKVCGSKFKKVCRFLFGRSVDPNFKKFADSFFLTTLHTTKHFTLHCKKNIKTKLFIFKNIRHHENFINTEIETLQKALQKTFYNHVAHLCKKHCCPTGKNLS